MWNVVKNWEVNRKKNHKLSKIILVILKKKYRHEWNVWMFNQRAFKGNYSQTVTADYSRASWHEDAVNVAMNSIER